MADITIRVKNASGVSLSGVLYRLMRREDLTCFFLSDKSLCYFFIDMVTDDFGHVLISCDHEKEQV